MLASLRVVLWSVLLVVIVAIQIMSLRTSNDNAVAIEELRQHASSNKTASNAAGSVFLFGDVDRPGTYALPLGERLTVKQLLFSAINDAATANVDVKIRRQDEVGDDDRNEIRVSLAKIYSGQEPDRYLVWGDMLHVQYVPNQQ